MVVLNFCGKIEPVCISRKLKLYISNLPCSKDDDWKQELVDEMHATIQYRLASHEKYGDTVKPFDMPSIFSQDKCRQEFEHCIVEDDYLRVYADNLIYLYFDYDYEDMPFMDWRTNCFDGRFCEEDYAEKVVDFIRFVFGSSIQDNPCQLSKIHMLYTSNDITESPYNKYVLFSGVFDKEPYIQELQEFGARLDFFLDSENRYYQLNYLMEAIHTDNHYNAYHLVKTYSLCDMLLYDSKSRKSEEDDHLLAFFLDSRHEKALRDTMAALLREMRNKIGHGDFDGFQKKAEEYAKKVMDGRYNYDYTEYSRQNWVLLNACCKLDDALRRIILLMLTDYKSFVCMKRWQNVCS